MKEGVHESKIIGTQAAAEEVTIRTIITHGSMPFLWYFQSIAPDGTHLWPMLLPALCSKARLKKARVFGLKSSESGYILRG
jgi:hypothetical protein